MNSIKIARQPRGKFRVVDGQIILLDAAEFERAASAMTPMEYVKSKWDVPANYALTQISDCTFRGVTFIEDGHETGGQLRVGVSDDNMPPHMHHEGIAQVQGGSQGGLQSVELDGHNTSQQVRGQFRYDMFENDSLTGLSKNELDGAVD